MGLEQVLRCDICGDTVLVSDEAAEEWGTASLTAFRPAVAPQPPGGIQEGISPEVMAGLTPPPAAVPPAPVVVCPKPACLAKWARERRAKPKPAKAARPRKKAAPKS